MGRCLLEQGAEVNALAHMSFQGGIPGVNSAAVSARATTRATLLAAAAAITTTTAAATQQQQQRKLLTRMVSII
jgi:hypothetical protein